MRVIVFNDIISAGGVERVMRDIVGRLIEKGHVVTIATGDVGKNYREDFDKEYGIFGRRCKYVAYNFGWKIDGQNKIVRLIKRLFWVTYLQFQALFFKDLLISIKDYFPSEILRHPWKKKVLWIHSDYEYLPNKDEFGAWCQPLHKQFDNVICVSHAAAKSVKKVVGDSGNLCVRYNPINTAEIRKKAAQHLQVQRDVAKPLFVAVGRIASEKNYTTLAKVCAKLQREFDFELWIVGDGDQREAVEQILTQENCDCVKILGMQRNPYMYLAKADFFVSTSLHESYGLAIQEALILGVPVLSTRCPAIDECLDSRFGMLIECNEDAIEAGMRNILENPGLIEDYKRAIVEEYDADSLWENRLLQIEELLYE